MTSTESSDLGQGMNWPTRIPTCLLLLAAPAIPQDPLLRLGESPSDAGPQLEIETLQGEVTPLTLASLPIEDFGSDGAVFMRFAGSQAAQLSGVPRDKQAWITLHCGASLEGQLMGGESEFLHVSLHGIAATTFPIDEVASVRWPSRQPTSGSVMPQAPEEGDRLYLRRGTGLDQIDGLVDSFSDEGVTFQGRFGQRTHAWKDVVALFIEEIDSPAPSNESSPVVLDILGGGRVRGDLGAVTSAGVELRTRGGSHLRVPLVLMRELVIDDGSFQFLGQLPIADPGPTDLFGGGDALGMRYPPRVGRNYAGAPLLSGGRTWWRGLGVHAPSRVTWSLNARYASLQTWVALDDSALTDQYQGSVIFRIHVDGNLAWDSGLMQGADAAKRTPIIDLAGAQTLVLEVDSATDSFFCDRANWLRPILIAALEGN